MTLKSLMRVVVLQTVGTVIRGTRTGRRGIPNQGVCSVNAIVRLLKANASHPVCRQ